MTVFEKIIRPFQSSSFAPPAQPLSSTPESENPDVLIAAGAVGATKLFNGSTSFTMTSYMVASHRERKRATTTKTITDAGSGASIDVEYIDALRTKSANGQESVYKYKRQP